MQRLTKRTLLLFLALFTSFSVIACKDENTTTTTTTEQINAIIPTLSNQDKIFLSTDLYDLTYGELYEEFKVNDGMNQLINMIDQILLSSYIDDVTQDEIDEKVAFLTYGTSDQTEIDALDPEDKVLFEKNYQDNMFLLGYQDNEDEYITLLIAKETFAKERMVADQNKDETWYVGPKTIAEYYQTYYQPELQSIKIRFLSQTDAKNSLQALNLVNVNGRLREYTGTKPINEVPTFDDSNTRELSNEEIVQKFVLLYNYVYEDYQGEVNPASTIAELKATASFQIVYEDVNKANASLASLMYTTLGTYDEYLTDNTTPLFYTYAPVKYYGSSDTSYYMILNLSRDAKVDVEDFDGTETELKDLITEALYEELKQEKMDALLESSGFITARVVDLHIEKNLKIYDYYLGVDYKAVDGTYKPDKVGHQSLVASFDDSEMITADELFAFGLSKNAAMYTIYAAQINEMMYRYFNDVYCPGETSCTTDLSKLNSDKLEEHKEALEALEDSFNASYYRYYYTFDEYLYLAYGAKSDEQALLKFYIKSALQPHLIYDSYRLNDFEVIEDYLQASVEEYYQNYFSLNVEHLLIFVDRNEDGAPDNYTDFYDQLIDQASYDTLLTNFHVAIENYLSEEGHSFQTLITDYAKASRSDALWGAFKNYGFYLLTEDLSASESLTYVNSKDQFEQPFVDGLIQIYQDYQTPAKVSSESIYAEDLITTNYGVHLVYAEKGTHFTKPSAKFTMTYDSSNNPLYTVGIENASDIPTLEQLKIYSEYRFYEIAYGTTSEAEETYGFDRPKLPTSMIDAIDAYFETIHDSMYVVGNLNIIVTKALLDADFINQHPEYCVFTETELKAKLTHIKEVYFQQVFIDNQNLTQTDK